MGKSKKKVKFVVFSDAHITKYNKFNEGNRRLSNGLDVLRRIKKFCKIKKAPAIFTGDLMDKEKYITNEVAMYSLPFFKKIWGSGQFKTYAITGNHDQSTYNTPDKQSPSYIKTFSKIFKGLECLDFKTKEFDDYILYGVPYLTHDIGLIETVQNFNINPNKINVLLLHTTMPGAKDTDNREVHSNIKLTKFEKVIGRFDIVLCGHIHKPEHYYIGKTLVLQVGAPQHQRLTDRNCDMGYWIFYEDFSFEFVHMKKYPKFVKLKHGEEKPDNHNFYVFEAPEKKTKSNKSIRKFADRDNKGKLAKNYMKEKGIKSKRKKEALVESLKNVS